MTLNDDEKPKLLDSTSYLLAPSQWSSAVVNWLGRSYQKAHTGPPMYQATHIDLVLHASLSVVFVINYGKVIHGSFSKSSLNTIIV